MRGEHNLADNTSESPNAHKGGADNHTHTIPDHLHTIDVANAGDHAHGASVAPGGVDHIHGGTVNSNSGSSQRVAEPCTWCPGAVDVSHRDHNHSFSTAYASAYSHNHSSTIYNSGSHIHSASSSYTPLLSNSTTNVPSYVALHYIIRIK